MKIKDRIEQIRARRPENADDVFITVFDNTTEYSPENVDFYLSDYDEFKSYKALQYELDTECLGDKARGFGFNHLNNDKK